MGWMVLQWLQRNKHMEGAGPWSFVQSDGTDNSFMALLGTEAGQRVSLLLLEHVNMMGIRQPTIFTLYKVDNVILLRAEIFENTMTPGYEYNPVVAGDLPGYG